MLALAANPPTAAAKGVLNEGVDGEPCIGELGSAPTLVAVGCVAAELVVVIVANGLSDANGSLAAGVRLIAGLLNPLLLLLLLLLLLDLKPANILWKPERLAPPPPLLLMCWPIVELSENLEFECGENNYKTEHKQNN